MALERFTQNSDFTESFSITLSGSHHALNTSLCKGSNTVAQYTKIYKSNGYCKIILSKFVVYCSLVILKGAVINPFISNCSQSVENTTILTFCHRKLEILMKGEVVISMASKPLCCTTQVKFFSGRNLLPYHVQSVTAGIASYLMGVLTEHDDRISLDNYKVKQNSYQDTHWWYMIRINLNGTKKSRAFPVWKVSITSYVMKFMFSMNNQRVISYSNIEEQHKRFQKCGTLSSNVLTSFPNRKRRYNQPSISLSSGHKVSFFKRNRMKVSPLVQTKVTISNYVNVLMLGT